MCLLTKPHRCICAALLVLSYLMPAVAGASVGEIGPLEPSNRTTGKLISASNALDILSMELEAHIVIMGLKPALNLVEKQVYLNLTDRSALENLKSILKGCSYAILFGESPYSYSVIVKTASGAFKVVSNAKRSMSAAKSQSSLEEGKSSTDPPAPVNELEAAVAENRSYGGNGNWTSLQEGALLADETGHVELRAAESEASTEAYARKSEVVERLNQIQQEVANKGRQESKGGIASQLAQLQYEIDGIDGESFSAEDYDSLLARIEKIQAQIASGEADRFYDKWSKIRDPKFVYNHWDDLERLQDRLAAR